MNLKAAGLVFLAASSALASVPQDFSGDYLKNTGEIIRVVVSGETGAIYAGCDSHKYVENRFCSYREKYDLRWSKDVGGFCFANDQYCRYGVVFENGDTNVMIEKNDPVGSNQTLSKSRRID